MLNWPHCCHLAENDCMTSQVTSQLVCDSIYYKPSFDPTELGL